MGIPVFTPFAKRQFEVTAVMSEKQKTATTSSSLMFAPQTLLNCFLTWLVPGLGYWRLGRKKSFYIVSGLLFLAILMGVILGGDIFPLSQEEGKLRMLGSYCQMGMGLPFVLAKMFMDRGSPLSVTYDPGTAYFLIAGMLNWLAVMDVFDISVKRK